MIKVSSGLCMLQGSRGSLSAGWRGSRTFLRLTGGREVWRLLCRNGGLLLLCPNQKVNNYSQLKHSLTRLKNNSSSLPLTANQADTIIMSMKVVNSLYVLHYFSQGVETQGTRQVSTTVPLDQIPDLMRALGFYPSEQDVSTHAHTHTPLNVQLYMISS